MRQIVLAALLALTTGVSIPAPTCQPGKMTYDNIDAVRYADGSGNWLFFWDIKDTAEYNGQSQSTFPGQYELRGSLQDAIAILERRRFFDLVPKLWLVTDTAEPVVTVDRCGIVTRLSGYDTQGENPELLALFRDFDAYIASAKKRKLDNRPHTFDYTMFGDYDVPTMPQNLAGLATPHP